MRLIPERPGRARKGKRSASGSSRDREINTHRDFIRQVFGITPNAGDKNINFLRKSLAAYIEWIGSKLATGHPVTLYGVGTFGASFRVGRKVTNQHGFTHIQKDSYVLKFSVSQKLKKRLRKLAENPSPDHFVGFNWKVRKEPSKDLRRLQELNREKIRREKEEREAKRNNLWQGVQAGLEHGPVPTDTLGQGKPTQTDIERGPDSGCSGGPVQPPVADDQPGSSSVA